jgi:hypothetical protein
MAYKYFGRLAGSTLATDAVTLTSPANTTTPFTAVLPASKFIAYGENATSAAFNRALTALSVNTDALAGVLDSPALRYEVLEPSLQAGNPGYSSLAGVAAGAQKLDLGAGVHRPVTWTYVGLHKDLLLRHMQVERIASRSDGQQLLAPSDIYVNAAAAAVSSSYFPTTSYTGTSDNALALKIPGVVAVVTDLPPYGGATAPTAVSSFDSDGCRLTNKSWEDLYARPGCLVSITGATNNRGLYRIASLTGGNGNATSKAVLTRAYTEVTVADGTIFNVGDLVGWRPEPSDQQNAGTPAEYVNRAYVVFKFSTGNNNQAVLYLSDLGGSEDLKIQGTAVAHKVNPTSTGTVSISRYGLVDLESGATQNASFVIGTYLLNLATVGANPIANHSSTISAILPANHPVRFDTVAAAYNATVCAPPGYVLNPVIGLSSNSLGGDLKVHAQVLTTAGENLRSGAGTASKGSFVPSTRFEMSPGYQSLMEGLFSWIHRGDDGGTGAGPQVSRFASTRQVLGEGLWYLTFQQNLPSIPAGTAIQIVPQPNETAYNATVVRVSGTSLWIKHVYLDGKQYGNGHPAIAAGGTLTYGNPATTYTVAAVWEPRLESTPGLYVPDEGLNAQYHNHYSANPDIRGNQGSGNRIKASLNRPLTVELPANAGQAAFQAESPQQGNNQDYAVIRSGPVGGPPNTIDMALEVVDGTTLRIKDANATAGVRFSGAGTNFDGSNNAALMNGDYASNILGAINQATGSLKTHRQLFTNALLRGAGVQAGAGLTIDIGDAEFVGLAGLHVDVSAKTGFPVPANSTLLLRWTGVSYEVVGGLVEGSVPIARITTSVAAVTEILDMRWLAGNIDQKLDIRVGGYGAHFSTVSGAIDFINYIDQFGPDYVDRKWRILVCGDVTEQRWNVRFEVDGVCIEGLPGVTITWDPSLQPVNKNYGLFDFGGRSDLSFKNLHIRYTPGAGVNTITTPPASRMVFFNNSPTQNNRLLFDNVRISSSVASKLHGYLQLTSGVNDLTVRNCLWEGASESGVYLTGQEIRRVRISGTTLRGSYPRQLSGGLGAGILIIPSADGTDIWVTDCTVVEWSDRGIDITATSAKVEGCNVVEIRHGGNTSPVPLAKEAHGIRMTGLGTDVGFLRVGDCLVQGIGTANKGGLTRGISVTSAVGSQANAHIKDCLVADLRADDVAAERYGVFADGVDGLIMGIRYFPLAGGPTGTEAGVRLQATANRWTVDACQTGGAGISNAGASTYIGAMNRDDA